MMKVLLAIEDPNLRLALELLLHEEASMTIVGTASETHGLQALVRTNRPDLVLIEWELPGRPMPAVLAEIGATEYPHQIIVLGDHATDRSRVLEAGAHAYVVKGERPESLRLALHQAVARITTPNSEEKTT